MRMSNQQMSLRFDLSPQSSPYMDTGVYGERVPRVSPSAAQAVSSRDLETCRFCGFRSVKYQTCVWNAGHPEDIDNLLTCCPFCEQVLRLDLVPLQRSGVLVWLPEVSQADLNRSMFTLYALRIGTDQAASGAREFLDRIMSRRQVANKEFGSDDPAVAVERLREKQRTGRTRARCPNEAAGSGLRLLPLDRRIVHEGTLEFNQFPMMLAFWRSNAGPLTYAAHSREAKDMEQCFSSIKPV
jgi:intracellular multiplication protein IcmJ